jgi:hypothetical protein
MRPLRWARDVPVLDGVVMDIIHVAAKIFLVAKGVFPIAALPYSAFALAAPAGVDALAFRQPSAESGFDQHPSHRVIDVSGRQRPYGVHMVGQHHHGVDMERVALFYDTKGVTQASDRSTNKRPAGWRDGWLHAVRAPRSRR